MKASFGRRPRRSTPILLAPCHKFKAKTYVEKPCTTCKDSHLAQLPEQRLSQRQRIPASQNPMPRMSSALVTFSVICLDIRTFEMQIWMMNGRTS